MGLNFGKKQPAAAVASAPPSNSSGSTGKINLTKGQRINLTKTQSGSIKVENGWTARGKDYDLKALVRYRDGRLVYVGAANKDESLSTPDGAVRHSGDARKAGELETITITWNPNIASIAVSSYSALENGQGSFRQYGVYVNITNGDQVVGINAADANADSTSYTLCFGEILFQPDGSFEVINLELYSRSGSERRVGYKGDKVAMDAGPEGKKK